jgi:hypothetical protein
MRAERAAIKALGELGTYRLAALAAPELAIQAAFSRKNADAE